MKGIIFSEFMEMVDETFSVHMTEQLLESLNLESGGIYTSVGTYKAEEMVALVSKLSELTSIPVAELLKQFGEYLMKTFIHQYPDVFTGVSGIVEFLPLVENHVHLEVKKLYTDAELPTFDCQSDDPKSLDMVYRSPRDMPDLAEGLIRGAARHFDEEITIRRERLSDIPVAELFRISVA